MNCRIYVLVAAVLTTASSQVFAGYEQPNYIDGCQSIDGRFVVTAECVQKAQTVHGPNKWLIHWRDVKLNKTHSFEPKGLQGGQVYGQLYVAPDGETLALWNHLTLWSASKSNMHGPPDLAYHEDTEEWQKREEFTKRLLIYKKDGTLVKELGVRDLLQPEEWSAVTRHFNRVEWLVPYDKMHYKTTPRMQYAHCRVSPDYTVIEFRAVPPRTAKDKSGRVIRVSLTDGRILAADEKLADPNKIPVRPFHGPDDVKDNGPPVREGYIPSLDPVRTAGKFTVVPNPPPTLKLVKDGFAKLDTPSWLPGEKCLLVSEGVQKLLRFDDSAAKPFRDDIGRGRVGPDGRFYGMIGGKFAAWEPGGEPKVILDSTPGGNDLSLIDIAVSSKGFAYVIANKEGGKGMLTIVDLAKKTSTTAFDGTKEPELGNPTGIAVAPDGLSVFVAIAKPKDAKLSGIYRFAIDANGSLDVAAGKKERWARAYTPDGMAFSPEGNLFCADGDQIRIFAKTGKEVGAVRVPKSNRTNVTFGGPDGRTLFATTETALHSGRLYEGSPIVQE